MVCERSACGAAGWTAGGPSGGGAETVPESCAEPIRLDPARDQRIKNKIKRIIRFRLRRVRTHDGLQQASLALSLTVRANAVLLIFCFHAHGAAKLLIEEEGRIGLRMPCRRADKPVDPPLA